MDVKKITQLHAELLQGIELTELSDKSLLKYGSLLLKQFRQAKSILRKLKPEEINKTNHWILVREHSNIEVDSVLRELQSRMECDPESFADGMLLSFAELVGSIRVAIFDEDMLDNQDTDADMSKPVKLIFDEDES